MEYSHRLDKHILEPEYRSKSTKENGLSKRDHEFYVPIDIDFSRRASDGSKLNSYTYLSLAASDMLYPFLAASRDKNNGKNIWCSIPDFANYRPAASGKTETSAVVSCAPGAAGIGITDFEKDGRIFYSIRLAHIDPSSEERRGMRCSDTVAVAESLRRGMANAANYERVSLHSAFEAEDMQTDESFQLLGKSSWSENDREDMMAVYVGIEMDGCPGDIMSVRRDVMEPEAEVGMRDGRRRDTALTSRPLGSLLYWLWEYRRRYHV